MDVKDHALFDSAAEHIRTIPYKPHWAEELGSIEAALLLQQAIYWWIQKGEKKFYKFLLPCQHELYTVGDSWAEELGFGEKRLRTAMKAIATKCTRGTDKESLRASTDQSAIIVYWTDSGRVTHYELNGNAFFAFKERANDTLRNTLQDIENRELLGNCPKDSLDSTDDLPANCPKGSYQTSPKEVTYYNRLPLDSKTSLNSGEFKDSVADLTIEPIDIPKREKAELNIPERQPPVSEAEREFFTQFHRKRWATNAQRDKFRSTEEEVGSDAMLKAVQWAAENGIPKIPSICTRAKNIHAGVKPSNRIHDDMRMTTEAIKLNDIAAEKLLGPNWREAYAG